jgi:hypothetical protein
MHVRIAANDSCVQVFFPSRAENALTRRRTPACAFGHVRNRLGTFWGLESDQKVPVSTSPGLPRLVVACDVRVTIEGIMSMTEARTPSPTSTQIL